MDFRRRLPGHGSVACRSEKHPHSRAASVNPQRGDIVVGCCDRESCHLESETRPFVSAAACHTHGNKSAAGPFVGGFRERPRPGHLPPWHPSPLPPYSGTESSALSASPRSPF